MQIYPYRTTLAKIEDGHAYKTIEEAGHAVLSRHHVGGRDWILLCRDDEPTVGDMAPSELEALIASAVAKAFRQQASDLNRATQRSRVGR